MRNFKYIRALPFMTSSCVKYPKYTNAVGVLEMFASDYSSKFQYLTASLFVTQQKVAHFGSQVLVSLSSFR